MRTDTGNTREAPDMSNITTENPGHDDMEVLALPVNEEIETVVGEGLPDGLVSE